MKNPGLLILVLLIGSVFAGPHLTAEVRLSVDSELYNTFLTVEGIDDWRYFQSGSAGVSLLNEGSRLVRGELVLDLQGSGGSPGSTQEPTINLQKFYLRPGIGPVLLTLGKTRSTWGAGLVFNAGDLIFGSETVDFNAGTKDPRTETAWLVNAEIPLGDFSFVELIVLPGASDPEAAGYDALPSLSSASAGARLSLEVAAFNLQTGYLYRGNEIAGIGPTGHRLFLCMEGIAPWDWHLSLSTSSDSSEPSFTDDLRENITITGGLFATHTIGYVMSLSWRLECLVRPGASFRPIAEEDASSAESLAGEYAFYVYPLISLSPRNNLTFSLSSILSPVDLSANSSVGVEWNIYEALILSAGFSTQTGERIDVFHPDNPGGISCTIGAKYRY